MNRYSNKMIMILSLAMSVGSCGKSDDSDSESGTPTGLGGVTDLSMAYPGTLAISVLSVDDESAGLKSLLLQSDDESAIKNDVVRPPRKKKEEAQNRLEGKSDRCFSELLGRSLNDNDQIKCYDFDSDMNPIRRTAADLEDEKGTKDGLAASGGACMPAFAQEVANRVVFKVDRTLALMSGILCRARKGNSDLTLASTAGESVDLKEYLANVDSDRLPLSVSEAKVTTVSIDETSGDPTYKTEIAFTVKARPGQDQASQSVEERIVVTNRPGADEGELTWSRAPDASSKNDNDSNAQHEKYDVVTVKYKKYEDESGTERTAAELLRAQINQSHYKVNANGTPDLNAIPEQAENNIAHNFLYVSFDLSDSGEGSMSYWKNPGGRVSEASRGFVLDAKKDESGVLKGCSISGAARNTSIRSVITDETGTKQLFPTAHWHPMQNHSPNRDTEAYASGPSKGAEGSSVTKQCFQWNEQSESFSLDNMPERGYEMVDVSGVVGQPEGDKIGDVKLPKRPGKVKD